MGWEEEEQRARPDLYDQAVAGQSHPPAGLPADRRNPGWSVLGYFGRVVAWWVFFLVTELFAVCVVSSVGPGSGATEPATGFEELIWLGLVYVGIPFSLLMALFGPPRLGGGGSTDPDGGDLPDSGGDLWD